MNFLLTIDKTNALVKTLLEQYPRLRDNDYSLISNVWNIELKKRGYDPAKMTGAMLLHHHSEGRLTSPETIRRARQKLQELHPDLRGESYAKRQAEGAIVRENINN